MKNMIHKIPVVFFACFFSAGLLQAQEYATDKGAGLFNITGNF